MPDPGPQSPPATRRRRAPALTLQATALPTRDAGAYVDVFDGHYRAKQWDKKRRREAERERRQSPKAVAASEAERIAAREAEARIRERHAQEKPPGTWWQLTEALADAGDADAKLVRRAHMAPEFQVLRQERQAEADAQLRELRAQHGPGLVSDQHPMLRMFVTKVHRVQHLLVGEDKASVYRPHSKLSGLYSPYVVGNGDMRGFLRVESDHDFAGGFAELRKRIIALGVPLPNIIVGHIDAAGRLLRPHLIWLLGASVCCIGSGRAAPLALLQRELERLTVALQPLGADPGGLSNSMRVKNPLSPCWQYEVMAETPYALATDPRPGAWELPALAPALRPLEVRAQLRAAPLRMPVADHPDPDIAGQSNAMFRVIAQLGRRRVAWFRDEENGSIEEFRMELAMEALRLGAGERAAHAIARSVSAWTWERAGFAKPRCASPEEVQERQAAAGRDTAAARRSGSVAAILAAARQLQAEDKAITQAAIAAAAGRSERTVRTHWSAVQLLLGGEFVTGKTLPPDKKGGVLRGAVPAAVPEVHRSPERSAPSVGRAAEPACGPSGAVGTGRPASSLRAGPSPFPAPARAPQGEPADPPAGGGARSPPIPAAGPPQRAGAGRGRGARSRRGTDLPPLPP